MRESYGTKYQASVQYLEKLAANRFFVLLSKKMGKFYIFQILFWEVAACFDLFFLHRLSQVEATLDPLPWHASAVPNDRVGEPRFDHLHPSVIEALAPGVALRAAFGGARRA